MALDDGVFGYDGQVDPTGTMEGLIRDGMGGQSYAQNTRVNPTTVMERLLRKGLEDYDVRAKRIQDKAKPKTLGPSLGDYGTEDTSTLGAPSASPPSSMEPKAAPPSSSIPTEQGVDLGQFGQEEDKQAPPPAVPSPAAPPSADTQPQSSALGTAAKAATVGAQSINPLFLLGAPVGLTPDSIVNFGKRLYQSYMSADPAEKAKPPEEGGSPEVVKGIQAGAANIPKGYGHTAEVFGRLLNIPGMTETGAGWAAYGKEKLKGTEPRVAGVENIRNNSFGSFISDLWDFAAYQTGQAVVSSGPAMATGLVGQLIAGKFGNWAAAGAASYPQNLGDVYGDITESKAINKLLADGKVSQRTIDATVAAAAVPMAMLDVFAEWNVFGKKFTQKAKQELGRRIVSGIVNGTIVEGSTEGLQQIISEWTQEHLGGDKTAYAQFLSVVNNVLGGAFGGMVIGGATSAVQRKEPQQAQPVPPGATPPPPPPGTGPGPNPSTGPDPNAGTGPDPGTGTPPPGGDQGRGPGPGTGAGGGRPYWSYTDPASGNRYYTDEMGRTGPWGERPSGQYRDENWTYEGDVPPPGGDHAEQERQRQEQWGKHQGQQGQGAGQPPPGGGGDKQGESRTGATKPGMQGQGARAGETADQTRRRGALEGVLRTHGFSDLDLSNMSYGDLRDEVRNSDILNRHGYSNEDMATMSSAERKKAIDEALAQGAHHPKPEAEAQQSAGAADPNQPPPKPGPNATGKEHADWLNAFNAWQAKQQDKQGAAQPGAAAQPEQPAAPQGDGTRGKPVKVATGEDLTAAEGQVNEHPTPGQAAAENYKSGHAEFPDYGLSGKNSVTIETKLGGTRNGPVDAKTNKPAWEVKNFPATYGRAKGIPAADKQNLDVFVLRPPTPGQSAYVLDQVDPKSGKYDEPKAFLGAHSREEAEKVYLASHDEHGPKRIGGWTQLSPEEFKSWTKSGGPLKRLSKAAESATGQSDADIESALDELYGGNTKPKSGSEVKSGKGASEPTSGPRQPAAAGSDGAGAGSNEPRPGGKSAYDELEELFGGKEAHHAEQQVEDVLTQTGTRPEDVDPVDIARAAEIILNEGFSPTDAFQLAVVRRLVEEGRLTPEHVAQFYGTEIAALLEPAGPLALGVGAAAPEPGAGGKAPAATPEQPAGIGQAGGQESLEAPQAAEGEGGKGSAAVPTAEGQPAATGGPRAGAEPGPAAGADSTGGQRTPGSAGTEQPAETGGAAGGEPAGTAEHEPAGAAAEAAVEQRAKFRKELETRGAARVGKADYKIMEGPRDGVFYYRKTENGVREEHGGAVHQGGGWSREAAVDEAVKDAFGTKEPGQQEPAAATEEKPEQPTSGPRTPTGGKSTVEQAQEKADEDLEGGKPDKNKFEDVGEKIGGARKDQWSGGLAGKDIDNMTPAERAKLVTKDNVFPRPDYVELVETDGVKPEAVYLIKRVYDRIATRPANQEQQKDFIQALTAVREVLSTVKTTDDMEGLRTAVDGKLPHGDTYRFRRTLRQERARADPLRIGYDDREAARKAVAEGFPNLEPWQRQFAIRQDAVYDEATKKWTDQIEWSVIRKNPSKDNRWMVERGLKSHEAAVARAKEEYAKQGKGDGEKPLPTEHPHLKDIKRVGPDIRKGQHTDSSDTIMNTFGYRGVEWGNWASGPERQKFADLAYDALHDLARVLNVSPMALSLNGTLAYATGSRGKGGKGAGAAHYDPGRQVTNMTKMKGAGSLAHEFWHALDHYLGETHSPNPYGGAPIDVSGGRDRGSKSNEMRRAVYAKLPPRLRGAFQELYDAIHFDIEDESAEQARIEQIEKRVKKNNDSWRSTLKAAQDRLRDPTADHNKVRKEIKTAEAAIEQNERWGDWQKRSQKPTKTESQFYQEAVKLGGKSGDKGYWARPHELHARAFEVWVFDRLRAMGNVSQYLVQGVEPERYAQGFNGNPYPAGRDRERINEAFEVLFNQLGAAEGKHGKDTKVVGRLGDFVWPQLREAHKQLVVQRELLENPPPLHSPQELLRQREAEMADLHQQMEDLENGLVPPPAKNPGILAEHYMRRLLKPDGGFSTITEARQFARQLGFDLDPKQVDEAIEFGVVKAARLILGNEQFGDNTPADTFNKLVELYERQPRLGTRTSTSVREQAYSTPVPLAYVASRLADVTAGKSVYEPTAGNGALLIEANPSKTVANEINPERRTNLEAQGFQVTEFDAAEGLPSQQAQAKADHPVLAAYRQAGGEGNGGVSLDKIRAQLGGDRAEQDKALLEVLGGKVPNVTLMQRSDPKQITAAMRDAAFSPGGEPFHVAWVTGQVPPAAKTGAEPSATRKTFDIILANPPFGAVKENGESKLFDLTQYLPLYRTHEIDHAIALRALDGMADSGRAVLILGGLNKLAETPEARRDGYNGKAKRQFYKALYDNYNVTDQFTVNGDLYDKQGAAWPVDVVVIGGRGKSALPYPAQAVPRILNTWGEVGGLLHGQQTGADLPTGKPHAGPAAGAGGPRGPAAGHGGNGPPAGGSRPGGSPGQTQPGEIRPEPVPGVRGGQRPGEGGAGEAAGPEGLGGTDRHATESPAERAASDLEIDNALDELFASLPGAKQPGSGKPTDTGSAYDELESLFGVEQGQGLGSTRAKDEAPRQYPPDVEAAKYEKVKDLFVRIAQDYKAFWRNSVDLMRRVFEHLREVRKWSEAQLLAVRPYLKQFAKDVREGHIKLGEQEQKQAPPQQGGKPKTASKEQETEHQVAYTPQAKRTASMDVLVPTNLKEPIARALRELEAKVGDLDNFVMKELGFEYMDAPPLSNSGRPISTSMMDAFASEQVDAIALTIDNMRRGSGFIIGDQTGIGKGRVNAGMLRWAIKQGFVPIFVTEKPNLYGDMYRDLRDTGIHEFLGREPRLLMTNSSENIRLDEGGVNPDGSDVAGAIRLKTRSAGEHNALLAAIEPSDFGLDGGSPKYDILFTTYDQMNVLKPTEDTVKRELFRKLANRAVFVFDESHNGGSSEKGARGAKYDKKTGKLLQPTRSRYVRSLLIGKNAEGATVSLPKGVLYSSATYAKRPDSMDLYSATNMRMAVENMSDLADAISRGGVPMQQAVANMLAEDGQYIRRERSFAGISYDPVVVAVNDARYDDIAEGMMAVHQFSLLIPAIRDHVHDTMAGTGDTVGADNATGITGVNSISFTGLMHNIINQMLLAMKAEQAVELAVKAIKAGQKPVLTMSNTMGAFMDKYAEQLDIKPGQPFEGNFGDIMVRYLDRTRTLTIHHDDGDPTYHFLTDEELGREGLAAYNRAKDTIKGIDFSDLAVSPVDYMKNRLEQQGYKVGEITGRNSMLEYFTPEGSNSGKPILRTRPGHDKSINGKRTTIRLFNSKPENGGLHAVIINRAGATGISMHSGKLFDDQAQRHMILVQPEADIATHMQMLGRIHRTGQVIVPQYTQMIAGVPAEKRPASVLLKKMGSLNANTTAARASALTEKKAVPDMMNTYGDLIAAQWAVDNQRINQLLNYPVRIDEDTGRPTVEGAMQKLTGRFMLLPMSQQAQNWDELEGAYDALIEAMDAAGENVLEAKTYPLKAITQEITEVVPQKNQSGSKFADAVEVELISAAKISKPYTSIEIGKRLLDQLAKHAALSDLSVVEKGSEYYKRFHVMGRLGEAGPKDAAGPDFNQHYVDVGGRDFRTKQEAEAKLAQLQGGLFYDVVFDPRQAAGVAKGVREIEAEDGFLGRGQRIRRENEQAAALAKFNAWRGEQLAEIEDEARLETERTRLNTQETRWRQAHNLLNIGQRYSLAFSNGIQTGILINVEQSGKTKNPLAGWSAEFAIASTDAKVVKLPFSRLYPPGAASSDEELAVELRSMGFENPTVTLERFDSLQGEVREDRYVLTGNLLAGFDWADRKGRIINYTMNDGSIRQGIIMLRDFDLGKQITDKGRPIHDAAELKQWLDANARSDAPEARTKDQVLALKRDYWNGTSYYLSSERARRTGGVYYTDKLLTDLIGDDFQSRNNRMVVNVDAKVIVAAIQRLQELGAVFHVAAVAPRTRKVDEGNGGGGLGQTRAWHGSPAEFNQAFTRAASSSAVIRTPAFKGWFRDSKVVDENGEPRVVYHGTDKEFNKFNTRSRATGFSFYFFGHPDVGSWFGSTPEIANQFTREHRQGVFVQDDDVQMPYVEGGHVKPVYLSIQNPMVYSTFGTFDAASGKYETGRQMRQALERAGHDGIVIENSDTDGGGLRSDYVAFNPGQIKSATGNRGTFEFSNPNIIGQTSGSPVLDRAFHDRIKASLDRPKLERGLRELVAHLTGKENVQFFHKLGAPENEGYAGINLAETSGAIYYPGRDLIQLALYDPKYPLTAVNAFHEAFHRAENFLLSDADLAILKREEARLRPIAAAETGVGADQMGGIPDYEVRAKAAHAYYRDVASGGRGNGFHIAVRRIFEKVMQALRRLRNYLQGLGLRTSEDIFQDFAAGKMAGNQRRATGRFAERGIGATRANTPEEEAVLNRVAPSLRRTRLPSLNQLYTWFKDDLYPIQVVTKELLGGGRHLRNLPARMHPYKRARLTRGSFGQAENFLRYNTFDFHSRADNGPSLNTILAPVESDLNGFRAYIIAKRAIELEGRGIRTGIPLPQSQAIVAAGQARYQPVADQLTGYQDRLLDYVRQSGILSYRQVAAMRDANKDYVPFYRFMGEDSEFGFGFQSHRGLRVHNPVRGIKGSGRQLVDPIESIVRNTFTFISLAERNGALQVLEDLALASPTGRDFLKRSRKVRPISVTAEEINQHLRNEGLPDDVADDLTIFRPMPFRPSEREIAIWRDGKRRVYEVGKELAEAVNALDRPVLNLLWRILGAPAKWLRAGAVLSPEFIARNPIRDQFTALAFSKGGYIPVYDVAVGLGNLFSDNGAYQNWLKHGGGGAAMVSLDRDYISRNVVRLQPPTLANVSWRVAKAPIGALRAISEGMENSTRVGGFARQVAAGADPMEAAYDSRELTLDFSRMGSLGQAVNALIAFWNAQFEGVDRAARALKDNPFKVLLTIGLSITLPSILMWFLNKDDPTYCELPQWEKDFYWHIINHNWVNITPQQAVDVPDAYKRQEAGQWMQNMPTVWRLPKPFELGVLFGSVPERLLNAFFTDNPHAFKELHKSVLQALLPNYIPQILVPFIEQFANKSTFTERPLIPGYLKDIVPRKYQAQPYTSETAQLLGNLISKATDNSFSSPLIIENYIRQWSGGLGMHMLSISDKALELAGVTKPNVAPERTWSDVPGIKAFASRFPAANTRSVQQFYETYEERKQTATTVKYLTKIGREEEAATLRETRNLANAEGIHKSLGVQSNLIRSIYRNPKMTPNEKRSLIDGIYLNMIEIAKRGNAMFKESDKFALPAAPPAPKPQPSPAPTRQQTPPLPPATPPSAPRPRAAGPSLPGWAAALSPP